MRYFNTLREDSNSKKTFSPQQARSKAESYCAYQERSQQEVRDKLYEWGLHQTDVEQIISELISANFLNEERFAMAYTLGKFRIKNWGKIKIKYSLKLKRVPDKMIQKSLNAIDPDDYRRTLQNLLEKKINLIREIDPYKRQAALHRYAASKGFESELISESIKELEARR